MKINLFIYLTVQILYLGKFFLLSYNLKGFQPINLQDSLITDTSCLNDLITLIFCMQKGSQNKKKNSNFEAFQVLNFHRVWSGMPKTAHNSRRRSEVSQELQLHNLSQQILLSNQVAIFIDQLEIYQDRSFHFIICWEMLR